MCIGNVVGIVENARFRAVKVDVSDCFGMPRAADCAGVGGENMGEPVDERD